VEQIYRRSAILYGRVAKKTSAYSSLRRL